MLELPTTAELVHAAVFPETFAMLPPSFRTSRSEVQLLAIALQESGLKTRRQGTPARPGPARGLWQFEVNGVAGVCRHVLTKGLSQTVTERRHIAFNVETIHHALEHDDVLACAFARLLLWTDPKPMPQVGDAQGALAMYLRTWRPGAASTPEGKADLTIRWKRNYPKAVEAVAE